MSSPNPGIQPAARRASFASDSIRASAALSSARCLPSTHLLQYNLRIKVKVCVSSVSIEYMGLFQQNLMCFICFNRIYGSVSIESMGLFQ